MIAPRETVILKLFARLQTLTRFQTVARVWQGVEDALANDRLPAIYLIELPEKHSKQGRHMPSKIDLAFDIVIVTKNLQDPESSPGAVINPILDQLDELFLPSKAMRLAGAMTVLDGLAEEVWIEGAIQKNYAYLSGRASVAVAPLHLRITNAA